MTIKWFKPSFNCVIFPLTQPQVANQQQQKKKKIHERENFFKEIGYLRPKHLLKIKFYLFKKLGLVSNLTQALSIGKVPNSEVA